MNDQEKAIIRVFLESCLALNTISRELPAIDIASELVLNAFRHHRNLRHRS